LFLLGVSGQSPHTPDQKREMSRSDTLTLARGGVTVWPRRNGGSVSAVNSTRSGLPDAPTGARVRTIGSHAELGMQRASVLNNINPSAKSFLEQIGQTELFDQFFGPRPGFAGQALDEVGEHRDKGCDRGVIIELFSFIGREERAHIG
jgi:hypothetical protein